MQTLEKIELEKGVVVIHSYRVEAEKTKRSIDIFAVSDVKKVAVNQSTIVFSIESLETYRFVVAKDYDLSQIAAVINEKYPGAGVRVFSHFENVWRNKDGNS